MIARSDRSPRSGRPAHRGVERITEAGTIRAGSKRARRFGRFGAGSAIRFPVAALFGERYIHIGDGSVIGPYSSLSAGVGPGDVPQCDPAVVIGSHTVIGKGSDIVGQIASRSATTCGRARTCTSPTPTTDTKTSRCRPASSSPPASRSRSKTAAWLGTGVVVLPGASIGRHSVIGARAVVIGEIPPFSVAVGNPARVVRQYIDGEWRSVD